MSKIKLSENKLKTIIKESIIKILNESPDYKKMMRDEEIRNIKQGMYDTEIKDNWETWYMGLTDDAIMDASIERKQMIDKDFAMNYNDDNLKSFKQLQSWTKPSVTRPDDRWNNPLNDFNGRNPDKEMLHTKNSANRTLRKINK